MNTQSKFEGRLERIATHHGLQLITNYTYANAATYRFEPKASFQPVLEIKCTFSNLDVVTVKCAELGFGGVFPDDNISYDKLDNLLNSIDKLLEKEKIRRVA